MQLGTDSFLASLYAHFGMWLDQWIKRRESLRRSRLKMLADRRIGRMPFEA
jgi:hypothetical protein